MRYIGQRPLHPKVQRQIRVCKVPALVGVASQRISDCRRSLVQDRTSKETAQAY